MSEHQVIKALQNAAKLIEARGWIQGSYGDHVHGFCSVGALNTATDTETYYPAAQRLAKAVPKEFCPQLKVSINRVIEYNDTPGRTRDEVLQLFRKAASDEQAVEASEGNHEAGSGNPGE